MEKQGRNNRLAETASVYIRSFRKLKQLRQLDLAQAAQLSQRHIQKIESGDIDLPLSTLSALGSALGIPACYLIQQACPSVCPTEIELGCPVGLLDVVPFPLFVINFNGEFLYFNKVLLQSIGATENGVSKKASVFNFLFQESQVEDFKKILGTATLKPDLVFYQNLAFRKSDGNKAEMTFKCKYLSDKNGSPSALLFAGVGSPV